MCPGNRTRFATATPVRLAQTQDAAKVALELGNSPAMLFKHYRELVTPEAAEEWFSIRPPENWNPPVPIKRRRMRIKRTVRALTCSNVHDH